MLLFTRNPFVIQIMTQRPKAKFTNSLIASICAPDEGRAYYYDSDVSGLMLRAYSSGRKSFYVYRRANGKIHNIKVGDYPDFNIAKARRQAKSIIGKLQDGVDVAKARKVNILKEKLENITLQGAFEDYLRFKDLKPLTTKDYKRNIRVGFPDWLEMPIQNITRDMVEKRLFKRGAKSKSSANRELRTLKAIFNYAMDKYRAPNGEFLVNRNPTRGLKQFNVPRRKTYIKDSNKKDWFKAVYDLRSIRAPNLAKTNKDLLLFLLFTGLRYSNGASLKWCNVDLKDKSFYLPNTKNNDRITLPLTTFTQKLLADRHTSKCSEFVFPNENENYFISENYVWTSKVGETLKFTFDNHDLRRTFLTTGESLDINPLTLKRLVGHRSEDVTEGYIGHDISRLRNASQRITTELEGYIDG